ncbi:hypothetical protein Q7P37_000588 [Cladosporium fusiforme]
MGPHRHDDEEEAADADDESQPIRPYHDDPEDSDSVGADSPLRQTPTIELEGVNRRLHNPTWQESVADRIPPGFHRAWAATKTWVKGPQPPRIYNITPYFPKVQHAPLALLDRYAPRGAHRALLFAFWCALWLLVFGLALWRSSFAAHIPGYGSPTRLGCGARYWSEKNGCGLNGDQCRPFSNTTLAFRCPANCDRTLALDPHAVGDREIVYKPQVVGGPADYQTGFSEDIVENAVYRGDSFICASAVHAGFINDLEGGCGVLALTGEQPAFSGLKRHSIESTPFPSYFPQTFGFLSGTRSQCKDNRWPTLAVTVFFTTVLSIFTTSPAIFFWSNFVALFFHVALVSDPPNLTNYYSLISLAFGRFLPACFCAAITYKYTAKRTLTNLTAQFEKAVLWLGPAWVGALNNYTFDRIPIQRLTPHDIQAQPGAIPALIIVVLSIFFIALGQAWSFRVEGRMPRYLVIYSLFVLGLLLLLTIPGENLRIHHYILALLLLPGTSFQNRPSLIYQGLLVGLFVNGIARWGFDSIIQTPGELLKDAQQKSLLPKIDVLDIGKNNITFDLGPLPIYDPKKKKSYDGISILVNDVERFRGFGDDRSYWDGAFGTLNDHYTWTWTRHALGREVADLKSSEDHEDKHAVEALKAQYPEYFRFGYMAGSRAADFTKAGVWEANGKWRDMKSGPSR